MKHLLGNSPKCIDCFYYREVQDDGHYHDNDGWCVNKYNCTYGINGKKYDNPKDRKAVKWMHSCHQWEEVETRLTHYEVVCMKPEPWRSENEKEYIGQLLNKKKRND